MGADAREGDGLCLRPLQQPSDQQHMGTAVRTAKTSPTSWDAFRDIEAFVDEVLAELAVLAADGTGPTRTGPKPPLAGAALRKATMAIWCVAFCGMQWRAIGQLCDIPFNTLYTLFARWTRLGLWRRLLDRLRRAWRLACGDTADPSTVVIDSRSADGTRPTRRGPKPALTGAALRKAIMAIWCVCFCGLQWRAIGQLCDIPFGTL